MLKSEIFNYQNGKLHAESIDLDAIALKVGTPCYVYSRTAIEAAWLEYDGAFGNRAHEVFYAVKANDNLSIIKTLHLLGSSFDVVSIGELLRVLEVGVDASRVVFSGVGKSIQEISDAVTLGVGTINIESLEEFERIEAVTDELKKPVSVAVRVNPDVDPKTHPYISTGLKNNKFGVPIENALDLYKRIESSRWITATGVACHIGSQLVDIEPIIQAVKQIVLLALELGTLGMKIDTIDVGGGLGISYNNEQPPRIETFAEALLRAVPERYKIALEPGRSIVGHTGILLTRVELVKQTAYSRFVIVDAAMNDFLRPSLYSAWHGIVPYLESSLPEAGDDLCDVVGPVCETGDTLATGRKLIAREGDLIAVLDTGAYGAVMSSNYNSRPRCAEVLVQRDSFKIVRGRQSFENMVKIEKDFLIVT
jgi:diaminopimelate decarboxylase